MIIDTLQNLGWFNFGLPGPLPAILVSSSAISSGVQALYLRFSRHFRSLTSSGDKDFCRMFSLRITTVVNWCQTALPMDDSCLVWLLVVCTVCPTL